MREWSESWKRSLRFLAAARFYLPEKLKQVGTSPADEWYLEFLHHREFELAMDELAAIGLENREFAHEPLFWGELALAAESMDLHQRAAEFRRKAASVEGE